MTRTEVLRLINLLLDLTTPMEERQMAAYRLSELIRILLPETKNN